MAETEPLNSETPLSQLGGRVLTPDEHFYVRSHFPVPAVGAEGWRLRVSGLVRKQLSFDLNQLLAMRARSMTVTLECAGNGRSFMTPAISGEQWGLGAVGTARWTGVLLADVLRRTRIDPAAGELIFRAADHLVSDGPASGPERFERSLALDHLDSVPVLLAYGMNGKPLPARHGFPLRAIVPSRYAVASVKWLTEIEAVASPFGGFFQSDRYVYRWDRNGRTVVEPVGEIRVRSLITHPVDGETVRVGRLAIRGFAWSGMAPIASVEVKIDGGGWKRARTLGRVSRRHWQRWELVTAVNRPSTVSIAARATDRAGNVQPERAEWNSLGYGNNGIQQVTVEAR